MANENKTIFTSTQSYNDAIFKAKMAGYIPIGGSMNKRGEYVIFARKLTMR